MLELYSIDLYVIIVLNISMDRQNRISQGYFRGTWTLKQKCNKRYTE